MLAGVEEQHRDRRINLRDQVKQDSALGAEAADHGGATGEILLEDGGEPVGRRHPVKSRIQAIGIGLGEAGPGVDPVDGAQGCHAVAPWRFAQIGMRPSAAGW